MLDDGEVTIIKKKKNEYYYYYYYHYRDGQEAAIRNILDK